MNRDYGTIEFEGKTYTLTQEPYINGTYDEEPFYLANAIDDEENEYEVEWEINDSTRDAYEEIKRQRENGETPNYSLVQDESDACDWDNPVEVRKIE